MAVVTAGGDPKRLGADVVVEVPNRPEVAAVVAGGAPNKLGPTVGNEDDPKILDAVVATEGELKILPVAVVVVAAGILPKRPELEVVVTESDPNRLVAAAASTDADELSGALELSVVVAVEMGVSEGLH